MTGLTLVGTCLAIATATVVAESAAAQPVPQYLEKAVVTYGRIEVKLPPAYLLVRWPEPPVRGYYAWKVTFGDDSASTVVLRTDSAIAAKSSRDVVRASALYRCPLRDTPVLECVERIQGAGRAGQSAVMLDITELAFVSRVRSHKPEVILRQMFEPGGRFRVDHVGTTYK